MSAASSSIEARTYRDDCYFRGRSLDQYRVNTVSSRFRKHAATSFAWKGRSSRSRLRLSNSVISPAVLGFLILFNARKMCSLRRRLEFGIFFIRWFHHLEELTQPNPAMSAPARGQREPGAVNHRVLAGSSLISTFRIISGWCSPASPTRVYEHSNPWGPSTLHFPVVICTRPDNGHPPLSHQLTQHMFDTGKNLAARSRVSRILHLDRHCHVSYYLLYKATINYFLEKTG